MTQSPDQPGPPGSLLPATLALTAIGLGYLWASWAARDPALAERTHRRLA